MAVIGYGYGEVKYWLDFGSGSIEEKPVCSVDIDIVDSNKNYCQ